MFDMDENNEELLEQINDILNEARKPKTEGTFTDKDGKEYHWTVVTNDEKQILYKDEKGRRITGDAFDIEYPTKKKALYKLVSIDSVDGQKLNPPHEVAMYKINHLLSNGIDVFKDRQTKIHEIGNFQLKGNKIIHGQEEQKITKYEYNRIYSTLRSTAVKSKEKIKKAGEAKSIEEFLKYFPDVEISKSKTERRNLISDIIERDEGYTKEELEDKDTEELYKILSDIRSKEISESESLLTEDDRKFKQELDSLINSQQNENLYVVDEGFIRFPALTDKENIRYDGIDDKESKIKRISDIFEDAEFKSLFGEGVQSIKEDVKDWENLEIDVSDNVNARLNDINKNLGSNFDRKFYACQVGGVKRSDVLVVRDNAPKFNDGEPHNPITIDSDKKRSTKHGNYERALRYPKKDDEIFYIEVKKGYEDAQYLKFEFRLDFKGTTPDTSSMNIIQMYGIDDDGMKELNTKLMEAWKNNDKLNHAYSEYKKNIDTLVKDLLSIKTIRNKFGDMLSDVNSFPEGFKKLSQIFNFYVLEWEHEYLVMKSSYLYTKLNTPNDTEQLNRISNVVTNLNEKMHRLTGGDMSAIKNDTLSFFDKFKMLYCTLISTDANKKEAEKYNKTVFSIDNIGNEELWDIIIHYYRDLKDVRYIQIGHDIYKLNGSKPGPSKTTGDGNEVPLVSGDDPLNMKDAKSQEELSKIPFNITLSVVKKTKYSRKDGKTKEVYDSESAGQKLFLDIKLSHPETSSGKGFDNISKINKTCKFISKKNNVSKIHEDDELIEHVNSILNEEDRFELEEGIETSKTKSNKFELDVAENVRRFLKSQNPPYNTLKVEHYEGSDLKYWSDIRVKNTNNGKRFWIEAKEDKYACLGSTSWKYRDGGWTCTTLEDNDPILKFMKQSLEENAQKFIRFCKDYLGTEDITLPGDLTDELVDAWKNSGSIEDTDNNVLFITNKIPITNFGQIISSFYRNSKNEPAYYIQVGDDLYTVAEDTNVLNLRTKDGRPLKTVAEAYRLGRIQFRLKGYDRPQKHYWSIYTDVKILADKENLDDNYSCSFNTEEKWPVIQSQETMNDGESEMSNNEVKEQFESICNEEELDEYNKEFHLKDKEHTWKPEKNRYAFKNKSEKYGGDDYITSTDVMDRINYRLRTKTGGENWFIGPDRLDHTKSNIMVRLDDGSDTTLNIKNIVKSQNKGRILYLELTEGNGMTTDEVAERLFEMTEFLGNIKPFYLVVMNKKDESTYICNGMKAEGNDVVLEFEWGDLMDYSEELSEAEQDIGGDKSDIADEVHGIKIWIDDIREAPQGFKWFHTVREFIEYVNEHGTEEIELIDTDHDAGDYQKFGGDYIRCFDYLDFIGARNITIHIHSANPVGANNIRRIISKNKEENGWREVRNTQSE